MYLCCWCQINRADQLMIAQSGNVTLVLFEGLGRRNRAVVPQNVLQTIDSFHPKTERHILQEPKQKLKNTETSHCPAVLLELRVRFRYLISSNCKINSQKHKGKHILYTCVNTYEKKVGG